MVNHLLDMIHRVNADDGNHIWSLRIQISQSLRSVNTVTSVLSALFLPLLAELNYILLPNAPTLQTRVSFSHPAKSCVLPGQIHVASAGPS